MWECRSEGTRLWLQARPSCLSLFGFCGNRGTRQWRRHLQMTNRTKYYPNKNLVLLSRVRDNTRQSS